MGRGRKFGPQTQQEERWQPFLDGLVDWNNVSGPRLAWESSGHLHITNRATDSAMIRDMLPVGDVRLLWVLAGLAKLAVWVDITPEQFSDRKHWEKVTAIFSVLINLQGSPGCHKFLTIQLTKTLRECPRTRMNTGPYDPAK